MQAGHLVQEEELITKTREHERGGRVIKWCLVARFSSSSFVFSCFRDPNSFGLLHGRSYGNASSSKHGRIAMELLPNIGHPSRSLLRKQTLTDSPPFFPLRSLHPRRLARISHRRVREARNSKPNGALREPISRQCDVNHQRRFPCAGAPFCLRFASRTLQVGEKCGLASAARQMVLVRFSGGPCLWAA